MRSNDLANKWLQESGVIDVDRRKMVQAILSRVDRYPPHIRWGYQLAASSLEWLFPPLLLGILSRASRLSKRDFERFQRRVEGHSCHLVRVLPMLFQMPLQEQLIKDIQPEAIAHPLDGMPKPSFRESYDVIIIGSGAGGGPAAWALSQRGLSIAVIEAGKLAQPSTTANAIENYYWEQGFTASLVNGFLPVFSGQAVGGTTVINSGTCLRMPLERMKIWDHLAGTNLAAGGLDRWYGEAEELLGVTVLPETLQSQSARLFSAGLLRLGFGSGYILPRNSHDCQAGGRCCFVCSKGAKLSTDRSCLPAAISADCDLLSETRAVGIREVESGVEVRVKDTSGFRTLKASKLILAAGAFGTPHLIRKNRLGNAWRKAGNGLRVHPAVKVFAYFPDPVHGEKGIPQGMGFRNPEMPRLNFESIFTPLSAGAKMMPIAGRQRQWWCDRYDHVASFGMSIQDRRSGWVRRMGGIPLILYAMDREDARELGRGILLAAKVWFAAGADRVLLPFYHPLNELTCPEDIERLRPEDFTPSNLLAGAFHPQGTCGIGRVVNPDLSLRGTRHIYVCDGSIFPDSPLVNPQLTIAAFSLRLANDIANR